MTWTYSDPSASDKDAVRLLIGDTDTDDQQLSDEEIEYLLTQYTNVYRAASLAAKTLAAKYSRQVGSSIETLRVFAADRYKQYMDLSGKLNTEYKRQGAGGLGTPIVTGVSQSDIALVESDEDRVKSAFKKEMFDIQETYPDDKLVR